MMRPSSVMDSTIDSDICDDTEDLLKTETNVFMDRTLRSIDRSFSGLANDAEISVFPVHVTFQPIFLNTISSKKIILTNSGCKDGIVYATLKGDSCFSLQNSTLTIESGKSSSLIINYCPYSVCESYATINITGATSQVVQVTGTCLHPPIEMEDQDHKCWIFVKDVKTTKNIPIFNKSLQETFKIIISSSSSAFIIENPVLIIEPSSTQFIKVAFDPERDSPVTHSITAVCAEASVKIVRKFVLTKAKSSLILDYGIVPTNTVVTKVLTLDLHGKLLNKLEKPFGVTNSTDNSNLYFTFQPEFDGKFQQTAELESLDVILRGESITIPYVFEINESRIINTSKEPINLFFSSLTEDVNIEPREAHILPQSSIRVTFLRTKYTRDDYTPKFSVLFPIPGGKNLTTEHTAKVHSPSIQSVDTQTKSPERDVQLVADSINAQNEYTRIAPNEVYTQSYISDDNKTNSHTINGANISQRNYDQSKHTLDRHTNYQSNIETQFKEIVSHNHEDSSHAMQNRESYSSIPDRIEVRNMDDIDIDLHDDTKYRLKTSKHYDYSKAGNVSFQNIPLVMSDSYSPNKIQNINYTKIPSKKYIRDEETNLRMNNIRSTNESIENIPLNNDISSSYRHDKFNKYSSLYYTPNRINLPLSPYIRARNSIDITNINRGSNTGQIGNSTGITNAYRESSSQNITLKNSDTDSSMGSSAWRTMKHNHLIYEKGEPNTFKVNNRSDVVHTTQEYNNQRKNNLDEVVYSKKEINSHRNDIVCSSRDSGSHISNNRGNLVNPTKELNKTGLDKLDNLLNNKGNLGMIQAGNPNERYYTDNRNANTHINHVNNVNRNHHDMYYHHNIGPHNYRNENLYKKIDDRYVSTHTTIDHKEKTKPTLSYQSNINSIDISPEKSSINVHIIPPVQSNLIKQNKYGGVHSNLERYMYDLNRTNEPSNRDFVNSSKYVNDVPKPNFPISEYDSESSVGPAEVPKFENESSDCTNSEANGKDSAIDQNLFSSDKIDFVDKAPGIPHILAYPPPPPTPTLGPPSHNLHTRNHVAPSNYNFPPPYTNQSYIIDVLPTIYQSPSTDKEQKVLQLTRNKVSNVRKSHRIVADPPFLTFLGVNLGGEPKYSSLVVSGCDVFELQGPKWLKIPQNIEADVPFMICCTALTSRVHASKLTIRSDGLEPLTIPIIAYKGHSNIVCETKVRLQYSLDGRYLGQLDVTNDGNRSAFVLLTAAEELTIDVGLFPICAIIQPGSTETFKFLIDYESLPEMNIPIILYWGDEIIRQLKAYFSPSNIFSKTFTNIPHENEIYEFNKIIDQVDRKAFSTVFRRNLKITNVQLYIAKLNREKRIAVSPTSLTFIASESARLSILNMSADNVPFQVFANNKAVSVQPDNGIVPSYSEFNLSVQMHSKLPTTIEIHTEGDTISVPIQKSKYSNSVGNDSSSPIKAFRVNRSIMDFGFCEISGIRRLNFQVFNLSARHININIRSIKKNWKGSNVFTFPPYIKISPLATSDVMFEFSPSMELAFEEIVQFESENESYTVKINGTGISSKKKGSVCIDCESLDFPDCAVGRTKKARLKISNRTNSAVTIVANVTYPFTCPQPSFSINPDSYVLFPIHFSPKTDGEFHATVRFVPGSGERFSVELHGTGYVEDLL